MSDSFSVDAKQPYLVDSPVDGDPLLPEGKPWRKGLHDFSAKGLKELKDFVEMYEPLTEIPVKQVRILLVGQIGAGKSSFFNTINSIYRGYVTAQAATGADPDSLTTKYRSYEIRSGRRGKNMNFRLCDTMGLEEEGQGLDVTDFFLLLDGHVPDSFQFQPGQRLASVIDITKVPELKDRIHVMAIVMDATSVEYMRDTITSKLRQIRQYALKRDIPVVVVLTNIDNVCKEVEADVTKVYHSVAVFDAVKKAAEIVRMPPSQVTPIKNYETETELDRGVDILALFALRQLIRLADNFFDEQMNKMGISLRAPGKQKGDEAKAEPSPHNPTIMKSEKKPEPLPPGWKKMANAEGQPYYCNAKTAAARHDRPMAHAASEEPPNGHAQESPLPPGWQQLTNAEGKTYYFNEDTAAIRHDRPKPDFSSGDASKAREKMTHLPPGWKELTNADGETYYFNEKTAAVRHDRPTPDSESRNVPKGEETGSSLPPGWQELTDAIGGKLYLEAATNKMTKERPTGKAHKMEEKESPLPPGWQELSDATGGKMYFETATNKITKERPKIPEESPLPSGWTELTDAKGAKVYLEIATNKMTPERPRDTKLAMEDVQQLPPGWTEFTDSKGGKVYMEVATNKMTHERPKITDKDTDELPTGWTELTDPKGGKLYLEVATNKTTHVRPKVTLPIGPITSAFPAGAPGDVVRPLPSGWEKTTDVSGQAVYRDTKSGFVTGDQRLVSLSRMGQMTPLAMAQRLPVAEAHSTGLPSGWESASTAEGVTYYYHAATGRRTWEKPGEE